MHMSNFDEFSKLPKEVQLGFVDQFKKVIDSAIDIGTGYIVFGEVMSKEQFNTIFEIVRGFDNVKKDRK